MNPIRTQNKLSLSLLLATAAFSGCKNPVKYETFRSQTFDLDQKLFEQAGLRTLNCSFTQFLARGGTEKTELGSLGECLHKNILTSLTDGGSTGYIDALFRFADIKDDIPESNSPVHARLQLVPFVGADADNGVLLTYLKSFRIGTPLKTRGAISRAEDHYFDHVAIVDFDRPVLVERLLQGKPERLQIAQFAAGDDFPTVQRIVVRSQTKKFAQNGESFTGTADVEIYASQDSDKPLLTLTIRTNWNPDVQDNLKISRLWNGAPEKAPFMMEMDFK